MLLTEWNTAEAIAVSRREGEEIGMEKGEVKGRNAEKMDIAKNLKKAGMSLEFISQNTGLSLEEIARI